MWIAGKPDSQRAANRVSQCEQVVRHDCSVTCWSLTTELKNLRSRAQDLDKPLGRGVLARPRFLCCRLQIFHGASLCHKIGSGTILLIHTGHLAEATCLLYVSFKTGLVRRDSTTRSRVLRWPAPMEHLRGPHHL